MGKRINLVWEESVSEHAEIHPLLFCVGVEPGSREGAESGKSCEVTAESKKKKLKGFHRAQGFLSPSLPS